jgi:hypothetical protein
MDEIFIKRGVRGLHMVQAWRARLSTLMGELCVPMDIDD